MRFKTLKSVVAGAGLMLAGAAVPHAYAADSTDAIKIAINEWTGQHISAHVAGELLKKAGNNVEYVTAGAVPQSDYDRSWGMVRCCDSKYVRHCWSESKCRGV